jgi:hypothetical protein
MWRRSSATALALCVAACAATTPLDEYQRTHPDWKPDFPRAGAGVQETLASIYAPHDIERGAITDVQRVRAFELGAAPRPVAAADLGSAPPRGDLVIAAHVHCAAPTAIWWFYNDAISWYLLRGGRLEAWRHIEFQKLCHAVLESEGVEALSKETRDGLAAALRGVTDADTSSALAGPLPEPVQAKPAPEEAAAEAACPGQSAFVAALRNAIKREPSIVSGFVEHDLTATIEVESDGSLEVVKIRPTDWYGRQLIQQVRKVSSKPDRPEAPSCLLGKQVDVFLPR